jgi:hypothetical protein
MEETIIGFIIGISIYLIFHKPIIKVLEKMIK